MGSNWVVRFHDDADDARADVERAVTRALSALGYRVLSVRPPLELNPEPLRIRTDNDQMKHNETRET